MIHFKFMKAFAIVLAVNLFTESLLSCDFSKHLQAVQAQETFADIHALYQYWCSNDYENFPENVGDVYCYYYNDVIADSEDMIVDSENLVSDPYLGKGIETTQAAITKDQEDIMEVPMDKNYVLIIGLTENTEEAQQEILSKLQDKTYVAFTSCKYSHREMRKIQKEITQMMTEQVSAGICGVGGTCNVMGVNQTKEGNQVNKIFYPMEQYIQVSILPEYYEKTTIILTEKYGDKIKTESCYIVDSVADCDSSVMIEEDIESMKEMDKYDGKDIDIGATTIGIGAEQESLYQNSAVSSKKGFQFQNTITGVTLGDTFTLKGNWKKTTPVTWKITGVDKVKVLSKKATGTQWKLQAKKAGYIIITAKNNKNKKTISQKVFIFDKNGTVSSQKKLTAALQAKKVKKITIKTEEEKEFTIPEGDYNEKEIIVNAPKSEIVVKEQTVLENMILKKSKQMKIFGITPQEAKQVFGEPIDSLSGLSGDIFKWKNKTKVIAYYDSDNLGNMIVDDKATIDKPVETVDAIGEEVSNNKNVFYGTILELYQDGAIALVEPEEGADIRSSGDQVTVNLAVNTTDHFSVGDRIQVEYDGNVMETYPLQIHVLQVEKA